MLCDDFIPLHGGQLREIAEQFEIPQGSLLDFSASVSPVPPSNALIESLCSSIRDRRILTEYPDKDYRDLKRVIASYAGIPVDSISLGNGVMPLLAAALRALQLRRCLVTVPAFAEYRRVFAAQGVEYHTLLLREDLDFLLDCDAVLKELGRTGAEALLLANPHSPSGSLLTARALRSLQEAVSSLGVTIIVDEAFIDYVPHESLSSIAVHAPKLIILRSPTKFFALSGLRLGYAISNPITRVRMDATLPLWPVDATAAAAVQLALEDTAHSERTRETNASDRCWLAEQLAALGLKVFPASANYLLIRLPDNVAGLCFWRRLVLEHGVVVRICGNFEGLTNQHIRIGVRSRSENQILIAAMTRLLSEFSSSLSVAG